MNKLPLSLRAQLVLLVGVAFLLGQFLSLVFFADERSLAVQAALGAEAAARAALGQDNMLSLYVVLCHRDCYTDAMLIPAMRR